MPHSIDARRSIRSFGRQRRVLQSCRIVLFSTFLLTSVVAVGCRRNPNWHLAPVEGTVTRAGQTLPGVQVVFLSDSEGGLRSSGLTDASGRYELKTDAGEQGGAVGKYRVVVIGGSNAQAPPIMPTRRRKLATASAKEAAPAVKQTLDDYGDYVKTPLRAEIRPGKQTLNFNLP